MEYELEVTVNSMPAGTQIYYFPLNKLVEGLEYVVRTYGHYDQWSVVVTKVYERQKEWLRKTRPSGS
jgi:hypothetical protein